MKVLPVLFSALFLFNSLLGQAPQSIAGKLFEVKEFEMYDNEELGPYLRQGSFSETHVRSYEGEIQDYTSEPYTYVKTGENTATLEVDEGDGEKYFAMLTFVTENEGYWILGGIRWRRWIIWRTFGIQCGGRI